MNSFLDSFAIWLADYYLLSTALLVLVLAASACLQQPVQRLSVAKSAIAALFLLAAFCVLPGWSLIHLLAARQSPQTPSYDAPPVPFPATEYEVPSTPSTSPNNFAPASHTASHRTQHIATVRNWPSINWKTGLAIAHALGAACVFAWLALGSLAASRLRRRAPLAPPELCELLNDIRGPRSGGSQRVELRTSDLIEVPVALGIRRPAILLPARWIARSLRPMCEGQGAEPDPSLTDVRIVLAHESAHIQNHDLHWLAASRALLILLWAQPLYWLLRRRMRLEQETLADAAAAELTSRQRYAEQLVAWARDVAARPTLRLSSAVGLWEGPSQLRRRIALLLNERFTVLRNCSRRWRLAAASLAVFAAAALSTVTLQPAIRAEEQEKPAVKTDPTERAPKEAVAVAATLPKPEPNTLVGQAVDEKRKPVAGAKVFLFRFNHRDATRKSMGEKRSDADGRFRFDDVIDIAKEFPGGKFPPPDVVGDEMLQLVVRAPGRVTNFSMQLPQVVAQRGQSELVFMQPAAKLRGRITGPDGKPLAGALVSFGYSSFDRWEGAQAARTDDEGNYEIDDVRPFDMEALRKQQEELQRRMKDPKSDKNLDAATWHHSPPLLTIEHPKHAAQRIVPEKIPGTQDAQLSAPAILEGRVVYGDTGKPAANVRVQIVASISREPRPAPIPINYLTMHRDTVPTDAEGKYRFATLPAGKYHLWAEAPDWVNEGQNAITATTEETNSVPDLTLTKGGLISIRLVDAASRQPIELPPDSVAMIAAQPLELRQLSRNGVPRTATINPDGRFEVRTLPGENQVFLSHVSSGGDQKWTGATMVGELPTKVTVADGQTTAADVPVVNIQEARAKAMKADVVTITGAFVPANAGDEKPAARPNTRKPNDGADTTEGDPDADRGAAKKRIDLPIIAARHALLLNGSQIITWEELEAKIAALPDPSLAYPHLYVTNGAREAGVSEAANDRVNLLHRKYKLQGHSLGSLSPRTDVRYDRIKNESDLKPDERLRMEGTVTDQGGKPIAGAEVVLVTPVDESISYKTVDIALVEGRLRNRLEEVVTETDAQGRFVIYPPPAGGPEGPHYYVVAMHPNVGWVISPGLTDLPIEPKHRLSLIPWAALMTTLEPEEGSKQSVSLRSRTREQQALYRDQHGREQVVRGGYPEVVFTQYWVDLNRKAQTNFAFKHVPPLMDTGISRDMDQPDGGMTSVATASVNLLPGESRQIGIGALSDKQREFLEWQQKESEKRREESRKGDGAGVKPAPVRAIAVAERKAADSKRPPALLSYGDGKADGKKSYGGSGHLIRFELPEGIEKVRGVRIHGSRYGLAQAPDEKFEITFLDEAGEDILHSDAVPYHMFKRGKEQWVRVMFDKEVELPKKFWIALNFNPHQTKGVYLSYDTSTKGEHSRVGLAGDEEEPKKTDFNGDWMVQVMLARPK